MGVDPRAIVAASNNADLYEAMFASQGLGFERLPHAFVCRDRPPPFYSNLTVLAPGHRDQVTAELRGLVQSLGGAIGLKDSFCELELQANGFEVLFGGSWIWRDAGRHTETASWQRIEDEAGLELWEDAWKLNGSPTGQRMFTPKMLARPEIAFLYDSQDGEIRAGCIANLSKNSIGISNVFSLIPSEGVFAHAANAVALLAPHLPVAGYETGADLEHARRAGFEAVGDLRILVSRAATF